MDTLIAGVSAAVALAALVVAIVVARSQTAIQHRVAAIEEARRTEELDARGRARVTVNVSQRERPDRVVGGRTIVPPPEPLIELSNEGPAIARGVQLDPERGPKLAEIFGLDVLPVDLQPGQSMTFRLAIAMGHGMTLPVTVQWTDEAGSHKEPFTLKIM